MAKQDGAAKTATADKGADTSSNDGARDWSKTLFLPQTDFPMRAGLPTLEPKLLERWNEIGLYDQLRKAGKDRDKFVLHDGPPYANGNIHIGHALNKILKDLVVKSQQMLGKDSNYVPGWDCHGLPIEWKIEQEYRAKGKKKDEVPVLELLATCRDFAQKWVDAQREEFIRLGVIGDWDNPYLTMAPAAEAVIARELMKFAQNGLLYRGSKPVMWSVAEQTSLAEAEIEYHDYQSDQIWVKFPVANCGDDLPENTSVVIWTTTPWTIPGNRAISFSSRIGYGLYEVTSAPDGNWAKTGDTYVLADALAESVFKSAKVEAFERRADVSAATLKTVECQHPLRDLGYDFTVPLLDGDHVTDDTGTGFVHTAPGHGGDDYKIWMSNQKALRDRGIDTAIPLTVEADGVMTSQAPGFTGKRVLKENGDKGDANDAVIAALAEAGNIIARGRLKHQYPHSWRSKKPIIYRNTPQWFIAMDKPLSDGGETLRQSALSEIAKTKWVPASGQNRITGMIEAKPDWVLSRQRAWGVPIPIFVKDKGEGAYEILQDEDVNARIIEAIEEKGISAWHEDGAAEHFLGNAYSTDEWKKVDDICDVWFDSACTHAFTLEDPKAFPGLAGIKRVADGGTDQVMYLEGSDQHRGWFHSSLLESCGTRGRAPYDIVLTHGFILDEKGQDKMSKSKGNALAPQEVMKTNGADILRLWVASADTTNDIRFGAEIIKSSTDAYRKIRNTLRWILGALGHFDKETDQVPLKQLPELERLMLHTLHELDGQIRKAYETYDYRKVISLLSQFMNTDLSAFYFDIRKDTLYCEPRSSIKRKAALTVIDQIFGCISCWLAPILSFTAEEAWLSRYPSDTGSVHLQQFPKVPEAWRDEVVEDKWTMFRNNVRRVVTGALELERAAKRMGSSLEAAPTIYVADRVLLDVIEDIDLAEACNVSGAKLVAGAPPANAFTLPDVEGVGVVPKRAEGRKCARSWRITSDVGSDPDYPDLSARDAAAVRELDAENR